MKHASVLRLLLLSAALVASGCGAMTSHASGPCLPKRISVAEARSEQPKQLVQVEGRYFHRNGTTRICNAVIGSHLHRCAGSSLVVRSYQPGPHISVHHANGVAWTSDTVRVFGLVSGTTLRVAGCA